MRLLVLGGTGFVGRTFLRDVNALEEHGISEVTLLTRKPIDLVKSKFLSSHTRQHIRVHFVHHELPTAIDLPKHDIVVHAAEVPQATLSPDLVSLHQNILHTVLSYTERVNARRLIYLSSGAVYGAATNLSPPYRTDARLEFPSQTSSSYGQWKYISEEKIRCTSQRTGLEHVIIRLFNVSSEYVPLNASYALGCFIRETLDENTSVLNISGSGSDLRSYIISDHLSGFLRYCLKDSPPNWTFNACGRDPVTIADLAKLVLGASGLRKELRVLNPSQEPRHYFGFPNLPAQFQSSILDLRSDVARIIRVLLSSESEFI